jgi:hypothetical protein
MRRSVLANLCADDKRSSYRLSSINRTSGFSSSPPLAMAELGRRGKILEAVEFGSSTWRGTVAPASCRRIHDNKNFIPRFNICSIAIMTWRRRLFPHKLVRRKAEHPLSATAMNGAL